MLRWLTLKFSAKAEPIGEFNFVKLHTCHGGQIREIGRRKDPFHFVESYIPHARNCKTIWVLEVGDDGKRYEIEDPRDPQHYLIQLIPVHVPEVYPPLRPETIGIGRRHRVLTRGIDRGSWKTLAQ